MISLGMKFKNENETSKKQVKNIPQFNRIEKVFDSILHDKIVDCIQPENSEFNENAISLNTKNRLRKRASNLSKYELEKIENVQKSLKVFDVENNLPVNGEATGLMDGINIPIHYVKKVIQFCKNIGEFNYLKTCDQLVILKHFTCDLMFVRSAFHYDIVKNGFYYIEVVFLFFIC